MSRHMLLLAMALLPACSLLGNAAKEGLVSAAGYPSFASFTLAGSLPANSSLQYTAYYHPEQPASCTFYSPNAGGEVPRKHIEQEETGRQAQAQDFSYRIPLGYHLAGCEMKLEAVKLNTYITHAPGDFGTGTYTTGLSVYDEPAATLPHFPASGELELRGTCMWLFRLIGKTNALIKILTCHKADAQWQVPRDYDQRKGVGAALRRDELDGKTVRLEIRQSEEQLPFVRDTWINTSKGWKPCLGDGVDDPYGFCDSETPAFKTFQMDGRECTVYPNCTE